MNYDTMFCGMFKNGGYDPLILKLVFSVKGSKKLSDAKGT